MNHNKFLFYYFNQYCFVITYHETNAVTYRHCCEKERGKKKLSTLARVISTTTATTWVFVFFFVAINRLSLSRCADKICVYIIGYTVLTAFLSIFKRQTVSTLYKHLPATTTRIRLIHSNSTQVFDRIDAHKLQIMVMDVVVVIRVEPAATAAVLNKQNERHFVQVKLISEKLSVSKWTLTNTSLRREHES